MFGYNLSRRQIDVEEYYTAMNTLKTSGLDITVLIICHLLKVKTMILVRDFIWKSIEADINEFNVFLMLFTSGTLYVGKSTKQEKNSNGGASFCTGINTTVSNKCYYWSCT